MKETIVEAPAKINIGLRVLSKRPDGYHNIQSLFYPVNGLSDRIFIRESDKFVFSCNKEGLCNEADNLVVRAFREMEKISGRKFNLSIMLEKNIPAGAGLGGGSSDCAAIIKFLNHRFSMGLDRDRLKKIGLSLGSDVPFFIQSEPAICTSTGEEMRSLDFKINAFLGIVNPGIHISTKEAYSSIRPNCNEIPYEGIIKAGIYSEEFKIWAVNDFETHAFEKHPLIKGIKERLYDLGAEFALMSGSGSTVYGIFRTLKGASEALDCLPENFFKAAVKL